MSSSKRANSNSPNNPSPDAKDSLSSFSEDDSIDFLPPNFLDEDRVKRTLWDLLKNPPSDGFSELLTYFSDYERSIMFCLMVGLSISEISSYKGISEVRIRQTITAIRYNSSWEEVYGTQETLDRRRKVRSKRRRD